MIAMTEVPQALFIGGGVLLALYLANRFYDLKVPQWLTRKISHLGGAMAYILSAYMFKSWEWILVLSTFFTLLLLGARLVKPNTFRGTGGSGRAANVMAEVYYPLSGTIIIALGWAWLGRPMESVAAISMMAIGDAVTGIVRSRFTIKPQKHWSGSIAMFLACLLIAWVFVHPFWIGALAASGATLAEWACGDVGVVKWADDNWAVPAVSAFIILGGVTWV